MSGRVALIGTSLGALVAAERLSAAGHDVWLFGRHDRAGGRWRGLRFEDGHTFDLDAALLMHRGAAPSPALSDFDIRREDDAWRFGDAVSRWLETVSVPVATVPAPQLHLADGTVLPDFLIGDDTSALGALPEVIRQAIASEVRGATFPWPEGSDAVPSLRALSIAHVGPTLHDAFIEPWIVGQTGVASAALAASGARALRVPRPAPREVVAAVTQQPPSRLAPVEYRRPVAGGIRPLVMALLARLAARPRVRWLGDVIDRLEPRGSGLVVHCANQVLAFEAWATAASAERLLPLFGDRPPTARWPQADALVACASVLGPTPTAPVHRAVDPTLPLRVVVQGAAPDRFRATIDWGSAPPLADEVVSTLSAEALVRLGLAPSVAAVTVHGVRRVRDAQPIPTLEAVAAHERLRAALDAHLPAVLRLGAASPVLLPTLDEELVGGLAAAERLAEQLAARGPSSVARRTPYAPMVRVVERPPAVSIAMTLTATSTGPARALHALLAQGVGEVEVVAVPVGDADESVVALRRFAEQHPELPVAVLVPIAGEGLVAAMHRAVTATRGALLVTLGADDTLVPPALADALRQLQQDGALDAVFGDRLVPHGGRTVCKPVPQGGALDLSGRLRAGAHRRALWDALGGWRVGALDPARDFWVAAALHGARGAALGVPFVSTPDATDRAACRLLGQDLEARAEIVLARARAFDAHTVAVASAIRGGGAVAPLVAAALPAPILFDGLVEWGDAADVAGALPEIARAWDAAQGTPARDGIAPR